MIESYLADIDAAPEVFAFEVIREVGIGGHFIDTRHTFDRCRTYSWRPEIGLRGLVLKRSPNEQLFANIERKMNRMLGSYRKPSLSPDILAALYDYMVGISGVDPGSIDAIHPKSNQASTPWARWDGSV